MNTFAISNNNTPLNNVGGISFTNTTIPIGPHTLSPPGGKVESATGIYPCFQGQKGGKINRKKINKISRKYKMKGSKRTIKRRVRRIKKRIHSRYSKRSVRRSSRHHNSMKGGAFQPPMTTPNYPAGHSQYLNNHGGLSNTYSLGGQLSAGNSALSNPPPQQLVVGASIPDNLNHNTLNAYGNTGAGSGFPSRGWF